MSSFRVNIVAAEIRERQRATPPIPRVFECFSVIWDRFVHRRDTTATIVA